MTYQRPDDPAEPVEPVEPVDPVRPVEPVEPVQPAQPAPQAYEPITREQPDETNVIERQTYVERPAPDPGYVPPAAAAAPVAPQQTNVNAPAGPAYSGPAYVSTGPGPLYWARRILSLLFGILFVLLALRIVLLLLVANQTNDIVNFVYNITEPFVAPFRGMFQFDTVSPGGASVFDVAALVALIGWLLIYLLIMAILRLADRDRPA
jgi:uncharacterized protein YggT (Ycf19 family)